MASWQETMREFFSRVGEYLRIGSKRAGEWIDEQAAINQRVRAIRRLRAEQRKMLEIIGSKVYTLHTRGKVRNRDVLQDCQRVDEILGHIERLRREIEEIKSKSRYPQVKLMDVQDDEPLVEPGDEEERAAPSEVTAGATAEAARAGPAPSVIEVEDRQGEAAADVDASRGPETTPADEERGGETP
ncbi:MAG: hypothetical protein H5T86_11355 [Armatimonadetes bacterium]|nr:hypothetical protein [Armatimonadota bacterium]